MTVERTLMHSVSNLLAVLAVGLFAAMPRLPDAENPTGLVRAREVFGAADRDADGTIGLSEAIRAKIPAADFACEDFDADARLSRDEFVLYYRHLLVRAGRCLGRDLDVEAARIQALRRIKCRAPPSGEAQPGSSSRASNGSGTDIPPAARIHVSTSGPAGSRLNARPSIVAEERERLGRKSVD